MKAEKVHFQISPASSLPRTHSGCSQRAVSPPRGISGIYGSSPGGQLCPGSEGTVARRDAVTWLLHLDRSIHPCSSLAGQAAPNSTDLATRRRVEAPAPSCRQRVSPAMSPALARGCSGMQRVNPGPKRPDAAQSGQSPSGTGTKPMSPLCKRKDASMLGHAQDSALVWLSQTSPRRGVP